MVNHLDAYESALVNDFLSENWSMFIRHVAQTEGCPEPNAEGVADNIATKLESAAGR